MRNPLYKRVPRDLKKNLTKYLGMIIILVCTISIGSSFQATLNAAIAYLDTIKEDNLQEDGFIEVGAPLDNDIIKHFYEDGIIVESNFYATERDYEDSTKVLIFDERTQIDIPTVFEGRLPEKDTEIIIDHVFGRNREINIGDSIRLLGRDYTVVGTASFPDYSSLFLNNTDLMMNTRHFCVAAVSSAGMAAINENNITYRYSYRFLDRTLKESAQITEAEKMMKYLLSNGVTLQNMLRRDQNQSITFLEMDIGTDGPFMKVFVYILVAMIAFIFAILTNNTIESEAVIIGTLRASGYTAGEIIRHYLQPTIIIAVIGSVVGNVIGYTVMIGPFIDIYYTTYSIGPLDIKFDVPIFILTTVLPVVIMIAINYFMLARKMSLSPLKFLRRELKRGKQKRTVKLPDFSFLNRFRLRVIIQNRGSYIMLFLGIFLASFLLMFGIGIKPLMDHYTETINESLNYDYQYILKAPVETDNGEQLFVYEMTTWFKLGKKDIGVTCFGIDEDSKYFEGAYVNEGIAISSALSKKMNLKEGDTLVLKDSAKDKEHSFTISKVYPYSATLAMFIDKSELNRMLDVNAGTYNCIISDKKLNIDERYIVKMISRTDMLGASNQMLDSFETIIYFVNVFSVVVYLVLIYILTKVVVDKNALSISYMKVFGYDASEIRKLYLTATTIVVITSLVVCIPLEILMFKYTIVWLSSMIEGYMEFYLPFRIYIEIIAIGIVAYFGINTIHMAAVKRIPMTDALKNRE